MYLYINVVGVIRKRISLAVCVGWGRWLRMKIFALELVVFGLGGRGGVGGR